MPDHCDAPHCRKIIKTNEERAWCSLCSRVMHKKCQQHVIKVEDIRICFYCNLSPDITVKTVERLKKYFTEKIEEKNKRIEKENNIRKNIITKDVTDGIKDTKIKANMKNVAEYKQQLNTNVVGKEQKANKAQEKHTRNPFNENNNGNDNDMIATMKKQEDQNQRNSVNGNTSLNYNDKIIAVKIDKTPRNPFSEEMQDYDKTTMIDMQDADKTFENIFSENMQEKGRNGKIKAEIRNNKESIDTEFQYTTKKQDGNDIQKYISSCNRRSGIDSNPQADNKDRKLRVEGHTLENTLKDHDNRSFSNIQDTFKINENTKYITKNESQAKLQEDVLKVLETVNSQNRLLENLFANDIRFEKSKNQNSSCNIM